MDITYKTTHSATGCKLYKITITFLLQELPPSSGSFSFSSPYPSSDSHSDFHWATLYQITARNKARKRLKIFIVVFEEIYLEVQLLGRDYYWTGNLLAGIVIQTKNILPCKHESWISLLSYSAWQVCGLGTRLSYFKVIEWRKNW